MTETLVLIAVMTGGLPWFAPKLRRPLVLAGSLLIAATMLTWIILVPLLYAWLTIAVSRTKWPTWQKLTLVLGVWLGLALLKWVLPRGSHVYFLSVLSMYWACIPPAIICLVVERGRGQLGSLTPTDDWTYLLSLPRFFLPFGQPIGAKRFTESQRPLFTPRLAISALGLGLYGALLQWLVKDLDYMVKVQEISLWDVQHLPRLINNALLIYCVNAAQIFCAVAVFRLLGYGLGSGFRFPLFASSINDGFHRWNYYYYEFVSTVLYLPLASKLRRWMPLWLAYILAGYPSILLGVWAFDNIAFQVAFGWNSTPLRNELSNWREFVGYLAVWTVIILPHVALAPLRRFRKHLWWRIAGHVLTIACGTAALVALYYLRVSIY
jgi:hypothetical protein